MMKKISILICILFCSIFVFAQEKNQTPIDWQKFSPDGEEFVVEIPKKMNEYVNFGEADGKKSVFASADYRKYSNGVYYFIFSWKLSPNSISTSSDLSEPLKSFVNQFDKEPETIKFTDFSGIKYEFKDSEDFYHTIIFVKTNNRAYRFHTIQEEKLSDDATRFLNSIHFFREVLKPKIYEETFNIISLNRQDLFNFPEWKNFPQSQSKPLETGLTPIKFTSRPRGNYTDLARNYHLSGTIIFEVEFLANGEIGKINALKRLPFGMTTSTLNAVKAIKFQPAMKEGVPITVVRQVQYSFSLI